MADRLPPWVKRHGPAHDAAEEEQFAAMSPQDRWSATMELCRLGWRLLAANDERERVLSLRDERSPEAIATWRRLMRRPGG